MINDGYNLTDDDLDPVEDDIEDDDTDEEDDTDDDVDSDDAEDDDDADEESAAPPAPKPLTEQERADVSRFNSRIKWNR